MLKADTHDKGNAIAPLGIPLAGDATLIATVDGWISRWDAMQAACDTDHNYALSKSGREREIATRRTIIDTRAGTLAGMRAKAAVIACLDYNCEGLIASLCVDLSQ